MRSAKGASKSLQFAESEPRHGDGGECVELTARREPNAFTSTALLFRAKLQARHSLAERLPVECRVAVDDVAGGIVGDAFEHVLPRAIAASERDERVSRVVNAPRTRTRCPWRSRLIHPAARPAEDGR